METLEVETNLLNLSAVYLNKQGVHEPTAYEVLNTAEKILKRVDLINRKRKVIKFMGNKVLIDLAYYDHRLMPSL